ncbi:MAG: sugar nucleotide-binding protein, partial [Massilia sp.]
TSWHGFTEAIVAAAGLQCAVAPIGSAEYPVPARRPQNSVMNSDKLIAAFCDLPQWRAALDLCMQ